MQKEEKTLCIIIYKCVDFTTQLSYHRAIYNDKNLTKLTFWVYTCNDFLSLAILNWSHLFGIDGNDLHWKHFVNNKETFRQKLLHHIGINRDIWNSYHEDIRIYRNKYIAHTDINHVLRTNNIPNMTIAKKATDYYYQYILKKLSKYSDYSNWPKDLKTLENIKNLNSTTPWEFSNK